MRLRLATTAFTCASAVALTAAPATAEIRTHHPVVRPLGVDVSSYQHGSSLDWSRVKAAGQDFGFVKATEGSSYTNPYLAGDWAGLRNAGMGRGAYHFAQPSASLQSAVDQARYFVAAVGTTQQPGALAPLLDLEVSNGLSSAQLVAWTHAWLDTVQHLTGRRPIIYTYAYFWRTAMADDQGFTSSPLFLADYHDRSGRTAPSMPLPGGWQQWTFWQYTDSGQIPGIAGYVDLDRYAGASVAAATWGATTGPVDLTPFRGQVVSLGASGPAVTALQQALRLAPADGSFGPQTMGAVQAFQRSHALPATGAVTPAMWSALIVALAPPAPVVGALASYRNQTLRTGSSGPAVIALQRVLRVNPADGAFGPMTTGAVLAFQRAHRLAASGVVDAATWAALLPAPVRPVPPVVGALAGYRNQVLRTGSSGVAVVALQRTLRVNPADGSFGPLTAAAVMAFQRAHRLAPSGIVDARTWSGLLPAPAPVRPAPPVVGPLASYRNQLLRTGSTGVAVISLQRTLHVTPADGAFGPMTAAAVMAFQRAHRLTPSGIVDAHTWSALLPSPLLAYRALVLRVGAAGAAVTALQKALHIPSDGAYGPQTYASVQAYQRGHRLTVNGIMTAAVWNVLIG